MDRREMLKFSAATLASTLQPSAMAVAKERASSLASQAVEQWGIFEIALEGPATGNPFQEVTLAATFTHEHRSIEIKGFYDGDGVYRIRFMPDMQGVWTCISTSSAKQLNGHRTQFVCTAPSPGNHGPVTTAHRFHFLYADGTAYFPFGTTTYALLFASDEDAATSLTAMKGVFNKTRACVLPKPLGQGPQMLPFPSSGAQVDGRGGTNDYTRFNPAYFRLLEKRILELQSAGIEADCILFHPYDAWGYKTMPPEADDFYLRYVVARLAAYRNVWWSIANEYDLIKARTTADWDRFFRIVQAEDPYSHLRSIHHSAVIYDHSKPWCTHASLQSYDFEKSAERRAAWNKPIIYDEIQYEGDVERRWGNLSAEEMTRRFWLAAVRGVYASHGEVFIAEETGPHAHEPSWSDAGRLRGESAPRIRFLHDLIAAHTHVGLNEFEGSYYLSSGSPNELYLWYFDDHRPARYEFPLPNTANFEATLIDPYAMTQTKLDGTFSGKSRISLPSRPYQAILFRKVSDVTGKPTGKAPTPEVQD
ncbi:DUF5060 domain-containing protein [Silvibacterium sp.]|uniref:DUF5060 domain-containing protein n=1 Tax=Silvibacterium sp. TaxID=1964179 RepID=UPI0039E5EEDF